MFIEISKIHKGMVNTITSILTKLSMGISGFIIALVNGWQMALVMLAFLPMMTISGYISSYFLKSI
jgi:ABC-type bacteriocin/lantibiotic exporter with double-glycine peptidase domain